MKIAIIGTGYVGLVTGTCLSELGMEVVCIDHDLVKIEQLQTGIIPIHEPNLSELVINNINHKRLSFATNLSNSLKDVSAVFIAVGTPCNEDNSVDISYILSAAAELSQVNNKDLVVIIKSTVPVGTNEQVQALLPACHIVSNPEFLREGQAINDFMKPDRIIVGTNSLVAINVINNIYDYFIKNNVTIRYVLPRSAELIKYAANSFLATKIAFINEIADLCEQVEADIEDVANGIGLDSRIGQNFLKVGPAFGGSCFPKDLKALMTTSKEYNCELKIINATYDANLQRINKIVDKSVNLLTPTKQNLITCLGLTFKANTDDVRESPSLMIINKLVDLGIKVNCYDPVGLENAKKLFNHPLLNYSNNPYEALNEASLLLIATEWPEFLDLNYSTIKILMSRPIIFDLRNMLIDQPLVELGFEYHCLGRK